ncbi:hypothetical protein ACP70R_041650 [Stipagrostis hirtigluma subsp. patula]
MAVAASPLLLALVLAAVAWSSPSQAALEDPAGLLRRAKESGFLDWMLGLRRWIHENPELGFEEFCHGLGLMGPGYRIWTYGLACGPIG